MSSSRLQRSFFEKPCVELAKALLGKVLVHQLEDGTRLSGTIVETEAYLGAEDKAAHSYEGKKTARNAAMFMCPGTAYVYHIYGTYTCINISSQGDGHAVLIRALDPLDGQDVMKKHRGVKRSDGGDGLKVSDLSSGPSKLTQALGITRNNCDQKDFVTCPTLWLKDGEEVGEDKIVISARVGIESAKEWADKPLRFYVNGNQSVSVRDKKAEAQLNDGVHAPNSSKAKKRTSTNDDVEGDEDAAPQKKVAKSKKTKDEEKMPTAESKEEKTRKPCMENKTGSPRNEAGKPRLQQPFFEKPCVELAKALLGKVLVHQLEDGTRLSGTIVETEAYLGAEDKAAHSYEGKKTARNAAMFMCPGTAYVYHIYGTYTCINISSQGDGHAVLIRALDPLDGQDVMKKYRGVKRSDGGDGLKVSDLGSGPSKLTQALGITRNNCDQKNFVTCPTLWLEGGEEVGEDKIVVSARVGIESAKEWADKPLRFYVNGNQSISVRDKKAEAQLNDGVHARNSSKGKKRTSTNNDVEGDEDAVSQKKVAKRKNTKDEEKKPTAESKEEKTRNPCIENKTGSPRNEAGKPRLQRPFYEKPCVELAKALLGKVLVHQLEDGTRLSGTIVETEAYLGAEDKAAHSYDGKKTARNAAMFMCPGTAYVYHIYGTYTCINISSQGDGHAVLIRALDPLDGQDLMKKHRGVKRSDGGDGLKISDLGSGPSKLTQALGITRNNCDQKDFVTCPTLWLEDGEEVGEDKIVISARVGVESAKEWAEKPLRFYVNGNQSVSVRDKKAEAKLVGK